MKYALGNMLNGAGGLNPDGLSLDLQFAADKTLTARKGPTPVLTRGSGNNGGTTYFGPLVDITGEGNEFPTSGITNGRAEWSASGGGTTWRVFYTGTRWKVEITSSAPLVEYFAATGSEWRPDQANWSGSGTSVITSSTFGIVKAANDEPRFDHNPVSPFACRGLLIEEGRTNLLVQSENFGTTWTSVNLNQTGTPPYLNVATAPDGATTADKLIATTTNGTHQFRQSVTLVSGTSYTISVYFKAAETNFAAISVFGVANGSTDWDGFFNISASSPAAGQFLGFTSTSLVDVGNGWRRCSVTFTATASGSLSVRLGGATSTNLNSNSYAGDGTSGFLLWGAQLEAGSFATSYIPTTTSTLARSADVCSITAPNFATLWNNNEGTVFASGDPRASASIATYLMANSGANVNQVSIYRNTTTNTYGIANSGSYTASISASAANGSFNKIAGSYITNDARVAFNNVLGTPDTSVIVPTNLTRLNIGSSGTANSEFANGCISAIRYYKKSLSNAKLQALTA